MAMSREEIRVYKRKYYRDHREERLAHQQKYNRDHQEEIRAYQQEHRWKYKEKRLACNLSRDKTRREQLAAYTDFIGCQCCGAHFPTRLEWHHPDPSTKKFEIGTSLGKSWESIFAEADRCVVLCHSCHQTEHGRLKRLAEKEARCGQGINLR